MTRLDLETKGEFPLEAVALLQEWWPAKDILEGFSEEMTPLSLDSGKYGGPIRVGQAVLDNPDIQLVTNRSLTEMFDEAIEDGHFHPGFGSPDAAADELEAIAVNLRKLSAKYPVCHGFL